MKKLQVLIALVLLVGILYQAAYLSGEYGQNLIDIRSNLGKLGLWRGANFNQSQKVADYIEFLNRNIPENARVVLPSLENDSKILVNPYMQFFLAPREVINCMSVECLQDISRKDTFILIVGNQTKNLYPNESLNMFDAHWGVLPPENFSNENLTPVTAFNDLRDVIRAGVEPLLWIAIITLLGTVTVISLYPGQARLQQFALGYGLGLGLFSLMVTAFSLLGFQIDSLLLLIVTGLFLIAALLLLYIRKKKLSDDVLKPEMGLQKRNFDLWPLIFTGLGVIVITLAVGKGYHRIDAIQIWGVKGYGIAADGTLKSVTNWGANTLAYPLHIPVLIATFRVLFGDFLPASKMIFGGYYFALIFLSYYTLLKMSVSRWIAGLAVLLIVTSPIIFRHGTIGYANLPTAFYLTCGVVLFMPVFAGEFQPGTILLSGFFMACAAWTRPEGLMLSISGGGLLLLLAYKNKHITLDRRSVFVFLAPMTVYLLIWQVVRMQAYPEPLSKTTLASDALRQILQGEFHIPEFFFIFVYLLQQLLTFKVWGVLGVSLLIGCVVVFIFYKFTSLTARVMIITGCLFLLMIVGMYFLTSFDSSNDISWWVTSGMNRMVFPGIIILCLGIIGAFHDIFITLGSNFKE